MSDFKYNEIMKAINNGQKPLVMFPIERDEIEEMKFKRLDDLFKTLNRVGKHLRGSCGITVSGYDDVTDELFEIEDVRKFVAKMFRRYPYMLYYMSRELEVDRWMLSSWADITTSARTFDQIMTAREAAERYGANPPKFGVMTTFQGGKFDEMIEALRKHGEKLGDKEEADKIAEYYISVFKH